ncbi:hypothetical protein V8G54_007873 [Vigna mungo]|uniref:Uncharacterized protein n=1 Tax=Vigna mungo TaxID=3915 RepID=A0AAQ3S9C6_VIGMU
MSRRTTRKEELYQAQRLPESRPCCYTGYAFAGAITASRLPPCNTDVRFTVEILASPMSFRSFLFLAHITKPYYRPHLSMCLSPLSSLHVPFCSPHIKERLVLDQISHLFPISISKSQNPVSKPLEPRQPEAKPMTRICPPKTNCAESSYRS